MKKEADLTPAESPAAAEHAEPEADLTPAESPAAAEHAEPEADLTAAEGPAVTESAELVADLPAAEGPAVAGSADLTAAEGPAVTEPAEPEADLTAAEIPAAEPEAPPAPRMERRGLVLAGLAVATVLFGAFGILASVAAHDLRAASAAANAAIVDRAATNAVTRDVTRAVDTIFSYSYADTATTKAAAQRLLTGPAIKQYDQLFKLVEQQAPAQHLVVTTNVTQVGVEFLGAGRARVLVFANQQDTRSGTTQSSYAGAMFAVTAVQRGGGWKIENIDTFSR